MNRKDVVIGFLCGLCLTLTLFAVIPTRSQPGYDAWTDVNDDGSIDMADLQLAIDSFMATGDPTKQVNLTGRQNKLAYSHFTWVAGHDDFLTPDIVVDGYSKMTVCILCPALQNVYALWTKSFAGGETYLVDEVNNFPNSLVKTYDVPNQVVRIYYANSGDTELGLYVDVYLIP